MFIILCRRKAYIYRAKPSYLIYDRADTALGSVPGPHCNTLQNFSALLKRKLRINNHDDLDLA